MRGALLWPVLLVSHALSLVLAPGCTRAGARWGPGLLQLWVWWEATGQTDSHSPHGDGAHILGSPLTPFSQGGNGFLDQRKLQRRGVG